jgi:hypothetical protein
LLYGLGFDDYISERIRNTEVKDTTNELNELVEKLGYLDLRDFIAINKYILQARNHEEYINQAKAKVLTVAIEKMNEGKNNELLDTFKKLDESNLNPSEVQNLKLEYIFNNYEDAKKFFYKYYYELKEFKEKEEQKILNDFDKYEKMMKIRNEQQKRKTQTKESAFDKYMDQIISEYRQQRTREIKIDVEEILENIKSMVKEGDSNKSDKLLLMTKYYAFFSKFNKIYTPTDMETEKLIVILINT